MSSRRPLHHRPQRLLRAVAARGRARDAEAAGQGESGFILLETMIALTLITTVMAAVGMQYVGSIAASSYQRSASTAAQLASSRMSELRAMNPTDLLRGRKVVDVTAQRDRMDDVAKVARWVSSGTNRLAYDNDTTKQNVVPTTATSRTVGTRAYDVDAFFECREDGPEVRNASNQPVRRDCLTATDTTKTNSLRAVVAVTWTGQTCANNRCAFVTSSVIDPHANPTFELNQELPAFPVIDPVPAQKVAIGDAVSKQLTVKDDTGAAPFTWSLNTGTLPAGLSISPAGLISGTVAGSPTTTSSKIVVTDAFLRQASVTISWTVTQRLTLAPVNPAPSGFVNEAATPFTLSASGGSGTGYRYADSGSTLPPGVTVNATTGRVSGTPTTVGSYNVTLSVTDDAGRTAPTSFTWTVNTRPLGASNPGDQRSTVGRAVSVPMSASGGSGTYTWSATGLPAGVTINPTSGLISGSPTSAGTSAVVVTVRDNASPAATDTESFSWTVYAAPTITAPPAQATTKGVGVDFDVAYTCPSGGCTIRFENQPNGVTVNDRGEVGGTVANNATGSTAVRLKITDATGATVSTSDFTWVVHERPTWSTIPNQTSSRRATVSFPTAGYVTQGNVPYVYSATGLPAGLSIDGTTGVVSGTTANSNSKSSNAVITVRDQSGVTVASSAFSWNVSNLAMPISDQSVVKGNRLTFSFKATGGTMPYTFAGGNFPSGFSASLNQAGDTVTVTGTPSSSGNFTPFFRVTDDAGAVVTTTFKLTVTDK